MTRTLRHAVVFALVFVAPMALRAADVRPATRPVGLFAAASIDRLMQDIETIAGTADRNDVSEQLKGLIANFGNFEGFDRERPIGVMVGLGGGLAPQPEPVGFLPVKDVDKFLKTIAFGPIRNAPVDGKPGRYELIGPDGKLQMRVAGEWAYIGKSAEAVEDTFPNPAELSRTILDSYDLAWSIDFTAIPEGLKQIGLASLRSQFDANLKKLKGKPDEEVKIHRAAGEEFLEQVDDLAKNGTRFTIGLEINQETKRARIEGRLHRKGDAPRAEVAAPPARFAAAFDPASPARFSLSARLNERQRSVLQGVVGLIRRNAVKDDHPADSPLPKLFSVLAATVESGRIDLLSQFVGAPPGPFTLVGGIGMEKTDELAAALPGVVSYAEKAPTIAEAKSNVETREGVMLHRLVGNQSNKGIDVLYGEKPALLFGAGKDALWFALGQDDASELLGKIVAPRNAVEAPATGGRLTAELTLQAGAWIGLQGDEGNPGIAVARNAFARGNDSIRLLVDAGGPSPRFVAEFDSGWLRLLGLIVGDAIDRGK